MTRQRLSFICLIAVFVGVAAFVLWQLHGEELVIGSEAPDAPQGAEPGPATPQEPDETAPLATAPYDPAAIAAARLRELGEEIRPDYGRALERGAARAEIRLLDGLGRPLENVACYDGKVQLWREVGDRWQRVPARLDRARWVVVAGPDGLEPGRYGVEVSLGSYGVGRIRFSLGRGEDHRADVRLEGWKRVIALRLRDTEGRPVPFVDLYPYFEHAPNRPLPTQRPGPSHVMRRPPDFEPLLTDHAMWDESWEDSQEWSSVKYTTEVGLMCVEVVAGLRGTVSLTSFTLFADRKIEGDFVGPQWDDHPVTLELADDYEAACARLKLANAGDEGRRSLLSPRPAAGNPTHAEGEDLADERRVPPGRIRLIVETAGLGGARPMVVPRSRDSAYRSLRAAGDGRWWSNLLAGGRYGYALTDGGLLRTAESPLVLTQERVQRLWPALDATPCRIDLRTSPTIAAWVRSVGFVLEIVDDAVMATWELAPGVRSAERRGRRHVLESALGPIWRAALATEKEATLTIGCERRVLAMRRHEAGGLSNLVRHRFSFTLDPRQKAALRAGALDLDLGSLLAAQRHPPKLVFRCVGDEGEGLAAVEGSVVPAEEDELAQAVRETSLRLEELRRRPGRNAIVRRLKPDDDVEPPEEIVESFSLLEDGEFEDGSWTWDTSPESPWLEKALPLEPSPFESSALELLGPELFADYGEEAIRRLGREGAWYDAHRRVHSDEAGYVLEGAAHLEAGQLYVLYLWSRSRDDLHPDRRVVFRAQAGVTDLGAIRLPSP